MSRRKMFSIMMIIILLVLFINIFLPFAGDDYESFSLWDFLDWEDNYNGGLVLKILIVGELIIAMLVCTLQLLGVLDDFKFVYFTLGYYFTYYLGSLFSFMSEDLTYVAGLGMWLGIIFSSIGIVIAIMGNRMNNVTNPKMYGDSDGNAPIGFDPKTGRPMYAQPVKGGYPAGYDRNMEGPYYR